MIADYRELLKTVRQRPGIFLVDESFASHVVLAMGMDLGGSGALLNGFREFLQARIGQESSLAWPGLVLWLVEPVGPKERSFRDLPDDLNRAAVDRCYDLLDEFLAIRQDHWGDVQIFGEYLGMLMRRGITYNHRGAERLGAALDAVGGVDPRPPLREDTAAPAVSADPGPSPAPTALPPG